MKEKPKPVHEIRLGHIKAAVWKNEPENGFRHNATFSRIYRDQGQWKSSESFGRDADIEAFGLQNKAIFPRQDAEFCLMRYVEGAYEV